MPNKSTRTKHKRLKNKVWEKHKECDVSAGKSINRKALRWDKKDWTATFRLDRNFRTTTFRWGKNYQTET